MTLAGNIYGVVLNDRAERQRLAAQFLDKPYVKPPVTPVVYMKPLSALLDTPTLHVPDGGLVAASTLACLISRDTGGVSEKDVPSRLGAIALALDLSLPASSYYRPAVAQKNGDARLVLGQFVEPCFPDLIRIRADDAVIHEWSLERLERPVHKLIADLGTFMTLKAGDVLLIGLPGDAPLIGAPGKLCVEGVGLPGLEVILTGGKP